MQTTLFHNGPTVDSPSPRSPPSVRPVPGAAEEEYRHWIDAIDRLSERYEDLHLRVLQRNLRILADPMTGDAEQADILAWIEAEPDRSRPVCPFSFHACLVLYDRRCDLDEIRCRIRSLNRRVLQRRRELTL